jgi:hypothetical protein
MKKLLFILLLTIPFIGFSQKSKKEMLENSFKLSPEMSKEDVLEIMGQPRKSDFEKKVEEWFYCSTNYLFGPDEHLVLYFHEGKLISKYNYSVTMSDMKGGGGSCERHIKMGNYKIPDVVVEIRSR